MGAAEPSHIPVTICCARLFERRLCHHHGEELIGEQLPWPPQNPRIIGIPTGQAQPRRLQSQRAVASAHPQYGDQRQGPVTQHRTGQGDDLQQQCLHGDTAGTQPQHHQRGKQFR